MAAILFKLPRKIWYGTVVTNMNEIRKHSVDLIRCSTSKKEDVMHEIVENAGWHLSYMGGAKLLRKNLMIYHIKVLKPEFTKFLSNI